MWPLPVHLSTSLTGPPTGDTGIYVWNVWLFQHELLDHGGFPFLTTKIFSLGPAVDLAQHNYTPLAGLVGVPLVPLVGVVRAFNLIYLFNLVLAAYAMYLLARDVVGNRGPAWLAGLMFAFAPALVARGMAHFSLVETAALPMFVLLLRLAGRTGGRAAMAGAGATFAWATYSDPYYGVYCLVLGAWHMAAHSLDVSVVRRRPRVGCAAGVDVWLAASAGLVAWIAATGGTDVPLGPWRLGLRSLHTPVLSLTVAAAVRLALSRRPAWNWRPSAEFWTLIRLSPFGVATSVVLLSPVLVLLAGRLFRGQFLSPDILWRSSTPGVDLLAFLLPNPNHPLLRPWTTGWLSAQPGGFVENVASVPLVALVVIAAAIIAGRTRGSRYWVGLAVLAGSCALGPFIRFAGVNLYVPTPWALARYVPVLDVARAPARFTALTALAFAVIAALALQALAERLPRWRGSLLTAFGVVLLFELLPAPRPLYDARHSPVYDVIATDPREIRVLELPFGVRDGLSSFGDFNASAQFNQTRHGKRLIGGYLSRVSPKRVEQIVRFPVLKALMTLSAREPLPPDLARQARARAPKFIHDARVGYVVVARRRAPRQLVDFAVSALDLELIAESETRSLYRPRGTRPPDRLAAREPRCARRWRARAVESGGGSWSLLGRPGKAPAHRAHECHEVVEAHAHGVRVRPRVEDDLRIGGQALVHVDVLAVEFAERRHRPGVAVGIQAGKLVLGGEADPGRFRHVPEGGHVHPEMRGHQREDRLAVGQAHDGLGPIPPAHVRGGGLFLRGERGVVVDRRERHAARGHVPLDRRRNRHDAPPGPMPRPGP